MFSGEKVVRTPLQSLRNWTPYPFEDDLLTEQHSFEAALERLEGFIKEDTKKHKGNGLNKPILCVFTDHPDEHLVILAMQVGLETDCILSKIMHVHSKEVAPPTTGLFDDQMNVDEVHEGAVALRFSAGPDHQAQKEGSVEIETVEGEVYSFNPGSAPHEAGEKMVLLTDDGREAIGLYKTHATDDEGNSIKVKATRTDRLERLDYVIKAGKTVSKEDPEIAKSICWPIGAIDEKQANTLTKSQWDPAKQELKNSEDELVLPLLGVVMPAIPEQFYFVRPGRKNVAKQLRLLVRRKNCKTLTGQECLAEDRAFKICVGLAQAVDRIHSSGLRHTDLSWRNILADEKTGDVYLIDVDSCHSAGQQKKTAVLGTPFFMAPELLAGKKPTVESDRYALAKNIYGTLMFDERDKNGELLYPNGINSSFFFLGKEDTKGNLSKPDEKDEQRFKRYGESLEALFIRAFQKGWDDPQKRPDAEEWADELIKQIS